jgi:hypothetical protein
MPSSKSKAPKNPAQPVNVASNRKQGEVTELPSLYSLLSNSPLSKLDFELDFTRLSTRDV